MKGKEHDQCLQTASRLLTSNQSGLQVSPLRVPGFTVLQEAECKSYLQLTWLQQLQCIGFVLCFESGNSTFPRTVYWFRILCKHLKKLEQRLKLVGEGEGGRCHMLFENRNNAQSSKKSFINRQRFYLFVNRTIIYPCWTSNLTHGVKVLANLWRLMTSDKLDCQTQAEGL